MVHASETLRHFTHTFAARYPQKKTNMVRDPPDSKVHVSVRSPRCIPVEIPQPRQIRHPLRLGVSTTTPRAYAALVASCASCYRYTSQLWNSCCSRHGGAHASKVCSATTPLERDECHLPWQNLIDLTAQAPRLTIVLEIPRRTSRASHCTR